MKKKILIAAAICASLFVVVPTGYVSAAEIETESIPQTQSAYDNIAIAPYKDVIVTKFRVYKDKLQYRRWNATRGYWVDKKWIDLT